MKSLTFICLVIFPTTLLVAIVGVAEETCTPGAVPWGAEEGFWVSVTAAAVQVREACRPPHSAGWSPHNG